MNTKNSKEQVNLVYLMSNPRWRKHYQTRPRNGIKQFIDNSGVYHWDASKKQYEHYAYTDSSREHYSFSGYYTVNSSSRAVGNASYINGQTTTITEPSFTEKLGNLGREMDAKVRSYEGANGMVRFANDLGKTSTRVKIAGLLVTASSIFLGPEMAPIGVGIFDAGEVLDKTATGLTITKDLSDENLKTAGIRFASELITTKQDGLINNTIMTEAQKLGGKAGSEVLIESARDSIIKKVNE
ncbi:MAG: hypothetical protein RI980_1739 [Bacteroidota bacterium]